MANEDLNEVLEEELDDATVITVPIDDTLSNSGEAADAKAVGDALALKADKSEVSKISVNGEEADNQGHILIDGEDIPMSSGDETTLTDAIGAAAARTGTDIPLSGSPGAPTIAEAISTASGKTAADIPMSNDPDAATVAGKIAAMDTVAGQNSTDIAALKQKAGDTIKLVAGGTETIADAVAARVKTVNGDGPDASGNVQVSHALTADNLTSGHSQTSVGEFVRRTSGGDASIPDEGPAGLSILRGNRLHVGYVPESLSKQEILAPREQGQEGFTCTINRDTFVAYVEDASGTYTLTYTTEWSEDPADYGVTVTGQNVSGDQIVITFTAEARGTIYQSQPETFVSTGYNLYDPDADYIIALKYSESYGYHIAGTYTAVKWSATTTGTKQTLLPVDGAFDIPATGYLFIEGGDPADTEVYMTWTDWPQDKSGFAAYTESVIDLADLYDVEDGPFPYGLLRVADVRDEVNFNTGLATSYVERLAYSAENLETAEASGRAYEYDSNWIYLERAEPQTYEIEIDGDYEANDHGMEYFTGTDVAVYAVAIYGNNLKNKLERDVLTISAQDLNPTQQETVRENIGAPGAGALAIVINGDTAAVNVAKGDYVCVVGSTISGIDDGVYTANAAVTAGTSFTSGNLTAVSGGGLNALNSKLEQFGSFSVEYFEFGSSPWSKTLDENSFYLITVNSSAGDNWREMYFGYSGSSSVYFKAVTGATNISLSSSGRKITMTRLTGTGNHRCVLVKLASY